MGHVFVEHGAVEHATFTDVTTRDLFYLCVPLKIDIDYAIGLALHRLHGLAGKTLDQVAPARAEFRPDAGRQNFGHHLRVVNIYFRSHSICELNDFFLERGNRPIR